MLKPPASRGRFIVFEGIDGSGKSTQARLAAEYLTFIGKKVHLTREPTNRPIGKLIREALSGQFEVSEATMASMFLADRIDHIQNQEEGIIMLLNDGFDVISDRYFWSSFAYHSLSLDMDWVIGIHEKVLEICPPDLTIYLDLKVNASLERIGTRNEQQEIFENKEVLTKVYDNYARAFDKFSDRFNIAKVNAEQSIEAIQKAIREIVVG